MNTLTWNGNVDEDRTATHGQHHYRIAAIGGTYMLSIDGAVRFDGSIIECMNKATDHAIMEAAK